jgi:hypothetical protein
MPLIKLFGRKRAIIIIKAVTKTLLALPLIDNLIDIETIYLLKEFWVAAIF